MQYIQDICLTSLLSNAIFTGPHHTPFHFTWDRIGQHNPTFHSDYNDSDAQVLLQLSFMITDSSAYGVPLNVPSWLENTELKYDVCPIELISKGIGNSKYNEPSIVANVLYSPGANIIFIVFVGTSNMCMAALDVSYHQTEYNGIANYIPGLRGHKGVYSIYMSIRDKLVATLAKYLTNNADTLPRIIITGHSLGGALSHLCALDLAEYNPLHYSFASPLIFNEIGYEQYEQLVQNSYRVANISDLVTLSPLPIMPNKEAFCHVGKLISFQHNSGVYSYNHTQAYAKEYQLIE